MDNNRLKEIRSNLSTLPILKSRFAKLETKVAEAEETVAETFKKYESETQDVENMHNESFSMVLLRLIGKYEGKLSKETQEELLAKTEYDNACNMLDDLRSELNELSDRIMTLKKDCRIYENELYKRKNEIMQNVNSNIYARYNEVDQQLNTLARQLVETDEAIRAANRVGSSAKSALECLENAKGWATYDAWTRGGIISHVAKYDSIDRAESYINRIESQMKSLQDELADVNLLTPVNLTIVDSMTRAVDFWFDNIFTDLNVRSIISNNQEQISKLCGKIDSVLSVLQKNKTEINSKVKQLETSKEFLLIE